MIDIEKAYNEFDKYVLQFNPNNKKIKLKIDHIKRVAKMSKKIAQELNLNDEQIKLSEIIGLFHDIGRFRQAQLYDTFNDRMSVNHAELSVEVLFDENVINNFNIEKKYENIIRLAVLNHNKNKIDDNLNNEELLFAKIIRDADKLDIYYTICEYDFSSIFWYKNFDSKEINSLIMDDFINRHFVNYSNIKTNSDQIPIFYAYIFDFNFDFSLKLLKEQKYLEKFTCRVLSTFSDLTVKKQVEELLSVCNIYISNNT